MSKKEQALAGLIKGALSQDPQILSFDRTELTGTYGEHSSACLAIERPGSRRDRRPCVMSRRYGFSLGKIPSDIASSRVAELLGEKLVSGPCL